MIWLLIFLYILIIGLEVPTLLRNKMYRELVVFTVVFALGIYLSLAQYYDWYLPNPFQSWISRVASHV